MMRGRSGSTISRELSRNALPKGGYKPASVDRVALSRCRRRSRLERLNPLGSQVRDRLAMGWAPEQIAGRLRQEGAGRLRQEGAGRLRQEGSEHVISHE